jgi:phage-related protein
MTSDAKYPPRPLVWLGDSKARYMEFPAAARSEMGHELFLVQRGQTPPGAKPLKGLGPRVFEIAEDSLGGTYRAAYTVRFERRVYVLHAFQKKSMKGIATSLRDVRLIEKRLKDAARDYDIFLKEQNQ